MTEIDIGEEAIDRALFSTGGVTFILKGNPANDSGEITTIEIYALNGYDLEGLKVGIFYETGENTLKCRSAVTIGEVTSGSKQVIPIDPALTVETGDYIGMYYSSGRTERDSSGGGGVWWLLSDHVIVNDENEYSFISDQANSLFGTSESAGTEHVHGSSDTLAISDSLSVLKIIHHSSGDTLVIGDSLGAPEMTYNVALADTLSISDVLAVAMTYNVGLADTLSISDALAIAMTYNVAVSDVLSISDLVSYDYLVAFTTPTEDLKIER